MIEIRNLSLEKRRNGKEFKILDGISLEIPKHAISLLLGKSGSGKTTILRCMAQIEQAYWGSINCNGTEIKKLSQKERSQVIGFVPQAYALFPFMSVLDNCAHPLRKILGYDKKSAYKKVKEKLISFEMEKLIHSYPHELSGGQQQRTSIVRALLLNPTFLLLDEPTSALDPENTALLIQILLKLKSEGKGIAVSSQDMNFARKLLDRVYFLEGGQLIETHDFETEIPSLPLMSKLSKFLETSESLAMAQV